MTIKVHIPMWFVRRLEGMKRETYGVFIFETAAMHATKPLFKSKDKSLLDQVVQKHNSSELFTTKEEE